MLRLMLGRVGILAACGVFVSGSGVMAGPLAPPAGPISSTYRTLSEVEPRLPINLTTAAGTATAVHQISESGSYFLTGDIVVPSGKSGIVVAAANVTIDMRGFTIRGEAGSVYGIADVAGATRMHVHDGHFAGLGDTGLFGNFAVGSIYRNLTATGCLSRGLQLAATSVGENLTARQCGQGIVTNTGVSLVGCSASLSTGVGFLLGEGGVAERCVATGNASTGFRLSARAMIVGSVARSNSGDGFSLGSYSEALECHADSNLGHGFHLNPSVTTETGAVLRRSMATSNALAGIRATGNRALIDENVSRNNGKGIELSGPFASQPSTVTRNFCVANSINYEIFAGHRVAPIVQPALSGAISGNTGGTAFSTDSMANIAE